MAGDFSGDCFSDIVVGARGNRGSQGGEGSAYVDLGGTTNPSRLIDLDAALGGAEFYKIQGQNPRDPPGEAVSAAGDFNGALWSDVIVGAPSNDSGGTDAGAARVVFGGLRGQSTSTLQSLAV